MLETERDSVIIGLQKIADTKSVSWWMRNVCLKASGMLRAVVDGRIENRQGHWIDAPALSEITCSVCGKTWGTCDNDTQDFCFCPACGAKNDECRGRKSIGGDEMKLTIIFKDEFEERMKKQFGYFTNPQIYGVKSVHMEDGYLCSTIWDTKRWSMDDISEFYCEEG